MAKCSAFVVSWVLLGLACVARAAEIADAPPPEPNYVGILVFLGLFFGVGIWFMWKVMRNKGDGKK